MDDKESKKDKVMSCSFCEMMRAIYPDETDINEADSYFWRVHLGFIHGLFQ